MRMDYLEAVKSADNMMEIYNLIKLINFELNKFNTGEYADEEYHTQLIEALKLAETKPDSILTKANEIYLTGIKDPDTQVKHYHGLIEV